MSTTLSNSKLTLLETAYIGAIEGALDRRDYNTAAKLGEAYDKRAARLTAARVPLRRRGHEAPVTPRV